MKYVVGKMPLVVMKFVGAKYGNKNVKMIFWGKMMLCSDEIFWGKIVSGNLPPVPQTTVVFKAPQQNEPSWNPLRGPLFW